jgi:proteasome inhibitor subunit 1 (PI31)
MNNKKNNNIENNSNNSNNIYNNINKIMNKNETNSLSSFSQKLLEQIKNEKPTIRNKFDAIILILHLVMKNLNFKCLGINENEKNLKANETLIPEGWNKEKDFYSFLYKHPQSSMTFIIKTLILGEQLLIHGLAIEDKKIHNLQINSEEYIKNPINLNNYDHLFQNLDSLITQFKNSIVNKLLPMSSEDLKETNNNDLERNQTSNLENNNRIPRIERREPEFIYSPEGRLPHLPRTPFGIGSNDLYPFPQPVLPPGNYSPGGPGSGNLIGPNHPGFGPLVTDPYGNNSPFGFPRLPRRGIPPYARFDPYGPPSNPYEPNPDDFPPPGFENSFL